MSDSRKWWEKGWVRAVIKRLIRRKAEYDSDPDAVQSLPITMSDFPAVWGQPMQRPTRQSPRLSRRRSPGDPSWTEANVSPLHQASTRISLRFFPH